MKDKRAFGANQGEPLRSVEPSRRAARAPWRYFSRLRAHFRRRRAARTAIRELYSMDERLLRDIGIEPGWIVEVVESLLDAGSGTNDAILEFTAPSARRTLRSGRAEARGTGSKAA